MLFWPALLVKLSAGVCIGLIYTYYYDGIGDTIVYFRDSSAISALARKDPGAYLTYLWNSDMDLGLSSDIANQPRTMFLLKLASVFNLLSHDNYWITSVYFSFISFIAAWYLTSQVNQTFSVAYWPAVVGFLFFPSAVFWSSGLIKESLAMAGLFLLWGCFLRVWFGLRLRVWEIMLVPVALWVVWNLKYYFLGVFIPVGFASLMAHKLYVKGLPARVLAAKIALWVALLVVPLFLVMWLHPNFHPSLLAGVIVDNYNVFHQVSQPEDLIYFDGIDPSWMSLLTHVPKAMFAGLFRPLPWEASTGLQWIVALENTLLLLMALGALLNLRALFGSPYRLLIFSAFLYATALATFLALSTPNFGTLSRYRVGFLSLFFTALATCNPLFYSLLRNAQRYLGRLAR